MVSQRMEPLGLSTKTLDFFLFYIFSQITVGRNFIEIPRVGLRGWSGSCGGNELEFVADEKDTFLPFLLSTGLGWF